LQGPSGTHVPAQQPQQGVQPPGPSSPRSLALRVAGIVPQQFCVGLLALQQKKQRYKYMGWGLLLLSVERPVAAWVAGVVPQQLGFGLAMQYRTQRHKD